MERIAEAGRCEGQAGKEYSVSGFFFLGRQPEIGGGPILVLELLQLPWTSEQYGSEPPPGFKIQLSYKPFVHKIIVVFDNGTFF